MSCPPPCLQASRPNAGALKRGSPQNPPQDAEPAAGPPQPALSSRAPSAWRPRLGRRSGWVSKAHWRRSGVFLSPREAPSGPGPLPLQAPRRAQPLARSLLLAPQGRLRSHEGGTAPQSHRPRAVGQQSVNDKTEPVSTIRSPGPRGGPASAAPQPHPRQEPPPPLLQPAQLRSECTDPGPGWLLLTAREPQSPRL